MKSVSWSNDCQARPTIRWRNGRRDIAGALVAGSKSSMTRRLLYEFRCRSFLESFPLPLGEGLRVSNYALTPSPLPKGEGV